MFRELQAELSGDVDIVHTSLTELSDGRGYDVHDSIIHVRWEMQHDRTRVFNDSAAERITRRPVAHSLTLQHEDGHECTVVMRHGAEEPVVAGLGDTVLVIEPE